MGLNYKLDGFFAKIPIIRKLPVFHFKRFWFPGFHPIDYELSTTPRPGEEKKTPPGQKKKR